MVVKTKTYSISDKKKSSSGDDKIAKFKSGGSSGGVVSGPTSGPSSNNRMETPQEYRARAEAEAEAKRETQPTPVPSPAPAPVSSPTATPKSVTRLDMKSPHEATDRVVIKQRAQEQQQQQQTVVVKTPTTVSTSHTTTPKLKDVATDTSHEYPTPYSPEYAQRVEMGKLVSGLQPSTTQAQDRRTLISEQKTVSHVPGQPTVSERLRDADRREGMDAMNLGRYEGVASRYEGAVGKAVAPAVGSRYKSARFIGGVAEGIAYTPVAIPRLAVGLATNPTATIRENVLGMSEAIIDDPARGTGQVVGAAVAGKGITKGVSKARNIVDISNPSVKAMMKSETASANYWQVKYDFSKTKTNVAGVTESNVPQIIPGRGLVSGKPYTGLHPLLEARISKGSSGAGVKAAGDMTALERYQASRGAPLTNVVETKTIKPVSTPSKRLSTSVLSDIESNTPRLVGIKRTTGKPLSEAPDSFFAPREQSVWVKSPDVVYKQPPKTVSEQTHIPRRQPIPEPARPRPTTYKEPAGSTLTLSEKSRLQRLMDGETLPARKVLPSGKTKSFAYPLTRVSPIAFIVPGAASLVAAKTIIDVLPSTQTYTRTQTYDMVKPSPVPDDITFAYPRPISTPDPLPVSAPGGVGVPPLPPTRTPFSMYPLPPEFDFDKSKTKKRKYDHMTPRFKRRMVTYDIDSVLRKL